jgi:outer membrane protein W
LKRSAITIIALVLIFLLLPLVANAQELENYFVGKFGVYLPKDDLDDLDFDTGLSGEIAFGHYFFKNFALEVGVGYFRSESSGNWSGGGIAVAWEAYVDVIPLTLTAKGILPVGPVELYAGAGGGVYFADYSETGTLTIGTTTYSYSFSGEDTAFGGHILSGVNFDVASNVFLGIEGKYIFTDDFKISGVDIASLNGYMVTGNIGYRF